MLHHGQDSNLISNVKYDDMEFLLEKKLMSTPNKTN